MNKKIIIIFILFFFIFKNIRTEKFTSNNFIFYNIYLSLEDKIREDLTIPKYHTFSPDRSKYLFNYTMNYNFLKYKNQSQKLEDHLSKVCFIKDNNLEETIVEKINDFLVDFLGSDTRIGRLTLLKDYLSLYKKFTILKFKDNFYKNLNKDTEITDNELIVQILIDILFSKNPSTANIKDTIINKLLELKWIRFESVKDYDNLDLLFEGIDQTYTEYINKYFSSKYNSILNLSISKIQNLFYGGDILDFGNNMGDFCK